MIVGGQIALLLIGYGAIRAIDHRLTGRDRRARWDAMVPPEISEELRRRRREGDR